MRIFANVNLSILVVEAMASHMWNILQMTSGNTWGLRLVALQLTVEIAQTCIRTLRFQMHA